MMMDYEEKYKNALERAKQLSKELTVDDIFEQIFPELKESEGEKIRKELITHCRNIRCVTEEGAEGIAKWITWLEKQGEKPQGKSALEAIHEQKVDNANKVEVKPKFKVDDWIIRSAEGFKHNTYLVTEVKDYYVCEELKGRRVTFTFNYVNKNFKLWDISDAKDGDVLVYNNIATEIIMLFRYKAINKPMAYTHFHIFDNDFRVYGCCDCGNGVHPATKEQRDHLFQKIEETGYKWDSDIKKLKRIETINIPFSAKNSELIEATYFIPEGFHAEIVDNKVIIKKD